MCTTYEKSEDCPIPVQEYIDGSNLGQWAAKQQPTFEHIAKVLLSIAEAIGYAHQQGLTHCDLKLANVLIDSAGQTHVADFGLAVHESTQGVREGEVFGTAAMMAPEHVRGEGHRLDGRTDIWAIGVMFYELLVGRRPFKGNTQQDLFNEILTLDPRPLRQIDPSVPRELERICLKCLSKLRTDRYNTTDDFREDVLAWLATSSTQKRNGSSTIENSSHTNSSLQLSASQTDTKDHPTVERNSISSMESADRGSGKNSKNPSRQPVVASFNAKLGGCGLSLVVMASLLILAVGPVFLSRELEINSQAPPLPRVDTGEGTPDSNSMVQSASQTPKDNNEQGELTFDNLKEGLGSLVVASGQAEYAAMAMYTAPRRYTTTIDLEFRNFQVRISSDGLQFHLNDSSAQETIGTFSQEFLPELQDAIGLSVVFEVPRYCYLIVVNTGGDPKERVRFAPFTGINNQKSPQKLVNASIDMTQVGQRLIVLVSSGEELPAIQQWLDSKRKHFEQLALSTHKSWIFFEGRLTPLFHNLEISGKERTLADTLKELQESILEKDLYVDVIAIPVQD